jgi:hypothetical protein
VRMLELHIQHDWCQKRPCSSAVHLTAHVGWYSPSARGCSASALHRAVFPTLLLPRTHILSSIPQLSCSYNSNMCCFNNLEHVLQAHAFPAGAHTEFSAVAGDEGRLTGTLAAPTVSEVLKFGIKTITCALVACK